MVILFIIYALQKTCILFIFNYLQVVCRLRIFFAVPQVNAIHPIKLKSIESKQRPETNELKTTTEPIDNAYGCRHADNPWTSRDSWDAMTLGQHGPAPEYVLKSAYLNNRY